MSCKRLIILFLLIVQVSMVMGQSSVLRGLVKDAYTNEPLPFVNIVIEGTNTGTTTNETGEFVFEGLEPGFIRLQLSSIGYERLLTEEINISAIRSNYVEISMVQKSTQLDEVEVSAGAFVRKGETPVSLRRIGIEQIEKSAGASRDLAKVLQSFPGVGANVSFRNDLIVRGGGPSENRFFLDGIEIPVLNHFSTQGASGGSVGILNVDFIREVDFYSSAFPAGRGNAMSSVFEFKQIDANKDKPSFKATLGASELSLSSNTPLGKKTGGLFSVRRSYLQFLFDQLGLPFLPSFTDFQFRTRTRFDEKNELILLGVGAIDEFKFNPSPDPTEENQYILEYLPSFEQWNYTVGASFKHFMDQNYLEVAISRSQLNNRINKYQDNEEDNPDKLVNDYVSDEIQNRLRMELYSNPGRVTMRAGISLEDISYYNRTYTRVFRDDMPAEINYRTDLNFFSYGVFGSLYSTIVDDKLDVRLGLRMDANTYSDDMNNPLEQLSPRLTLSYRIATDVSVNFNAGRYYQLPPYTTMGYKNNLGQWVNKDNGLKYIHADHLVGGVEWLPNSSLRISVEAFWKRYRNYPFSVTDSVALASKGADYGVLGDEEVTSTADGRTYGLEFLVRRKSSKGYSYILAYTLVSSEFTDAEGNYVPSSWDAGHLLTFTFNKSFSRHWDFGMRWRLAGGLPYTPYDRDKSELVAAWDVQGREYLDYSRFNESRLDPFHQLDLRVDKTWLFSKFSLGVYLDIQNVYNRKSREAPKLIQVTDENGNPVIQNPEAPEAEQRYELKELVTSSGTVLPTIGVILEF
ncbi:TonB-dependent receptor [Thermophagus xiamenensis]|uniref:TonB-dependent receptor n=1 Tax=Thermophagus xiamenensis TaxID=385682 RepID=UPI000255CCC0|nr:TonB-dependent receptor [Thermophagus xiamenensis]